MRRYMKIGLLFVAILSCCLLNSCRLKEHAEEEKIPTGIDEDTSQIAQKNVALEIYPVITDKQMQIMDVPSNATILLMYKDLLIYYIEKESALERECVLYQYNYCEHTTKEIGTFYFPDISADSIVAMDDNLYLIGVYTGEDSYGLYEINVITSVIRLVAELPRENIFSYIYPLEKSVAIHSISVEDNIENVYRIEKIDLPDGIKSMIVEKRFVGGSGTCIPCMCTEGNKVYAFEITVAGKDVSHQIVGYTIQGDTMEKYSLNLTDFLQIENKVSKDSVFYVAKQNDYYVLNTINGRVLILRFDNGILVPIEIPNVLHEKIPSGYRLLSNINTKDYFFLVSKKHSPNLCLLDTNSGELMGIDFGNSSGYPCSCVTSYGHSIAIEQDVTESGRTFFLLRLELFPELCNSY